MISPSSKWGEWIRFISSAVVIPISIAALLFALRVDRFMTKTEIQMVTRAELEIRLSAVREISERPSPFIQSQLADLKDSQANLANDMAQLRRDVINLMVKGKI